MLVKTLIVIALAFFALGAFRWAAARPRAPWVAPALVGVGVAALLWRFGIVGVAAGALAAGLMWFAPWRAPAPKIDIDAEAARALLGVTAQASRADIRAAHRKLIAEAHPDRGDASDRAARLNAARDLLLSATRDRAPGA